MHYLIDGNNLMPVLGISLRRPFEGRRTLIRYLVELVATRRGKVQVVFDGQPDAAFPDGRRFKGVQVYYSRRGSDADTRIKDMLTKSSYRRDTVLVSSDRSLGAFASGLGAKVMLSSDFKAFLEDSRSSSSPDENIGSPETLNVGEWMDFFGMTGSESER